MPSVPFLFGFWAPSAKTYSGSAFRPKHYLATLPTSQGKWDGPFLKIHVYEIPKMTGAFLKQTNTKGKIPQPGGIVLGRCGSRLTSYSGENVAAHFSCLWCEKKILWKYYQPYVFCTKNTYLYPFLTLTRPPSRLWSFTVTQTSLSLRPFMSVYPVGETAMWISWVHVGRINTQHQAKNKARPKDSTKSLQALMRLIVLCRFLLQHRQTASNNQNNIIFGHFNNASLSIISISDAAKLIIA